MNLFAAETCNPPYLADVPPVRKPNHWRTAFVVLSIMLVGACANPTAPSIHDNLHAAETITADNATATDAKASSIEAHGKAIQSAVNAVRATLVKSYASLVAAIDSHVGSILTDAAGLHTVAQDERHVSTAILLTVDDQAAKLVKERDAAVAETKSAWRHVLYGLEALGIVGIVGAGYLLFIGDVKPALFVGAISAGTVAASILFLRYAAWIEAGFLVTVAGGIVYLLATKTTAIHGLVQLGENIKTDLSKAGSVGNDIRAKIFGQGTDAGSAHATLSPTTQKIVARARGKKPTPVRLAVPLVVATTSKAV